MQQQFKNIILTGNPNSGKSSLFNALTGLKQQVGNFPGVTVEKKVGTLQLSSQQSVKVIDLPGTYSLYPRRADEWVAYKVLMGFEPDVKPTAIVVAIDASNLKRNLLFCTQIMDLQIPIVIALTMMDIAINKDIKIDVAALQQQLNVPVVVVNPRKNKGLAQLKQAIETVLQSNTKPATFLLTKNLASNAISDLQQLVAVNDYTALHYLINHEEFDLPNSTQAAIEKIEVENNFNPTKTQAQEVIQRYEKINSIIKKAVSEPTPQSKKIFSDKLDNVLLHRVWGYGILLFVLFFLFQSVFWLAQFPMDGIEWSFKELTTGLHNHLPENNFTNLLLNGIIAGLSGILVFVPQIMILFGLISIIEDTGYMARISFLSDKLMRAVGLNGKSVMPMISGFACAVPAIMATRNIENRKERLLTILVTPFMSCSARLPVFTILIALVVPPTYYFGFLSLQGLVLMSLYILGIVFALLVSYVAKWFIHIKDKSYFILELPTYRAPRWKNVITTMLQKAKIFVVDAGKIIMVISILLWFLCNYSPTNKMQLAKEKYEIALQKDSSKINELQKQLAAEKLEYSYAGYLGKAIEPVIKPLGYDWKIGIALITSFAAREVFVGTMATLYSVEETNNEGLREKMRNAKRKDGSLVYTLPTALSLMMFYLLAMQCMSTLAIVKRETKTWKIPIIQLVVMTGLAYVLSFFVYWALS